MSTNFSFILSRQLEGDWHRLGWDVKQCISDLRTLSQLFHHLIEYGEYSRGISKNDVTAILAHVAFRLCPILDAFDGVESDKRIKQESIVLDVAGCRRELV